jgi:DNA mismatch repair protein PMS2
VTKVKLVHVSTDCILGGGYYLVISCFQITTSGSTRLVRLFQQGLHIIEVSDDGCGISTSSLPFLATRHATSKISSIDDIYNGTGLTMGFRGEALFSMACVSKELVVATRTEDDELATKMVFGKDGMPLEDQTQHFSRKVGTTVAVVYPYISLPARLADLTRRIRQERTKIYKLIEAYGIFNVGVSFQLIDIGDVNGVGTKTILQTSATSTTLKETVSHLLTPSLLRTMKEVEISLDSILERIYGENSFHWGIKGLLSEEPSSQQGTQHQQQHPPPSSSSSSSSRKIENRIVQFYCINGRVVDLPKVSELLQKLWKAFGGKKKPKIILSFTLPNEAFDINLSPDKQTVLLTHERELLSVIEKAVTDLWSSSGSRVFDMSNNIGTQDEFSKSERNDTDVADRCAEEESDDDEEEDGSRPMHKRRFAFVHDLSNAKMQHDMDDRQIQEGTMHRDCPPAGAANNCAPDDVSIARLSERVNSTDSRLEEPPNKKTKKSSLPTEHQHAAVPPLESSTSTPEIPGTKLSDTDRRQWIEIQSKFRRSSSSNTDKYISIHGGPTTRYKSDELEGTHEVTPDKVQLPIFGRNSRQGALESTDNKMTSIKVRQSTSSSSKQLRLTDLKQFAFRAPASDSNNHQARTKQKSSPVDSNQWIDEVHQPVIDRNGPVSMTVSSPSPKNVQDEESMDKDDDEQPTDVLRDNNTNQDEDGTVNENEECIQVVWPAFQSTEQVCHRSRTERLNMIRRKRDLDNTRRLITTSSQNSSRKGGTDRQNLDQVDMDGDNTNEDNEGYDGHDQSTSSIRMSKSTFRNGMQVIGQFNLGFIFAKCSRNQLWILDQHACDEKYNFELLCKTTLIHEQPLIRPLHLELSPAEEACVLDHMDIFQANGFRFNFDPNAPIRHRLSLKALPHSGAVDGQKAVQFGPSDVSALCSILMEGSSYDPGDGGTGVDGSGRYGNNAVRRHASRFSHSQQDRQIDSAGTILARLPKAIAMFASRACRTSIMIGTALSHQEMNKVVQKLAELDMPFTCAHGRPTMNHLGDLSSIFLQDERRAAEYIATPTITMLPLSQPDKDEVEE